MPTLTMPATSTQPVQQQVLAIFDGLPYNPSGDTVAMAFQPSPSFGPAANPAIWYPATWEVDSGPTYWASCLVGPANGGVVLTAGEYVIFVKVTDNPAVPVLVGWDLVVT